MNTKDLLSLAAVATVLAASSAQGAIINIPNYTLTPNGTNYGSSNAFNVFEDQRTDVATPSGGTIVKSTDAVAYFVTTFRFGAGTSAEINLNFTASAGQERLGVTIRAGGLAFASGDGANGTADYDFGGSLAGETVTIIGKFEYNATFSDTYGQSNASNDTIATFWINPTGSETEGSGAPDGYAGVPNANYKGDFSSTAWNSSQFSLIRQRINNNNTLAGNGNSAILNTTVLTGTDATFSGALALATVPEPSAALLGGLGFLALLLRRR